RTNAATRRPVGFQFRRPGNYGDGDAVSRHQFCQRGRKSPRRVTVASAILAHLTNSSFQIFIAQGRRTEHNIVRRPMRDANLAGPTVWLYFDGSQSSTNPPTSGSCMITARPSFIFTMPPSDTVLAPAALAAAYTASMSVTWKPT